MKESMLLKTLSCHREQRINEGTKVDRKETILEQKESHIPPNVLCEICKERHRLYKCQKYKNSAPEEKFALVKGKKILYNCLKADHFKTNVNQRTLAFKGIAKISTIARCLSLLKN